MPRANTSLSMQKIDLTLLSRSLLCENKDKLVTVRTKSEIQNLTKTDFLKLRNQKDLT